MDVYVDILFLINGCMDALCLALTARLLHRTLSMGQLIIAAILGGVYGAAALFWEVGSLTAWLLDVGVCLLMCLIALGRQRLWLSGGVFLLSSMVMGGVMTALFHWLNRAGLAQRLPQGEEGVSSVAFLLLAVLGGLFTLLWGRVFRRSESRRAVSVKMTVALSGQSVTVMGMIDSGNLLTDPMSGTPVIAVDREQIAPLLSEPLWGLLQESPVPFARLTEVPEGGRLRLIPTKTATGEGMLVAIRPDEIKLTKKDQDAPVSVNALICPVPLSGAPAAALIPARLLVSVT